MPHLISDAEMTALRAIPVAGMDTPVTLLHQTKVEGDYGSSVSFTSGATLLGWLWEVPAFPSGDVVGGIQGNALAYRLYLPVGTLINPGDRVSVGGAEYEILSTNAEDTYQAVLRCSLRRL